MIQVKYVDVGNNVCLMDLLLFIIKILGIVYVVVLKYDFQGFFGCGVCFNIVGSGKFVVVDLDGLLLVEGSLKGIIVD